MTKDLKKLLMSLMALAWFLLYIFISQNPLFAVLANIWWVGSILVHD